VTPQSDEDEVWRQIIASFNEPAEPALGHQPWPDAENLPADTARRVLKLPDDAGRTDIEPGAGLAGGADDGPDPGAGNDADPERDPDEESDEARPEPDDEGHYVPPPPPPLPKTELSTKIAWVALFGGPAYLLFAAVLGWQMHGWVLFAAVAAFIGGFVALVVRMGDGPGDGDSGWDDGAVI
jgi:hypothetical protein